MRPLATLLILLTATGCTGLIGDPGATPGEPLDPSDATDPRIDPATQPAPGTPPLGSPEIAAALAQSSLRRLTPSQYENAVHDVFGDDVLVAEVPGISKVAGYTSVGASLATVSRTGVETLEELAYDIAEQVFREGRDRDFVTCSPSSAADAECAREVVAGLGARLFRRPLSEEETTRWVAIVMDGAAIDASFDEGLSFAVAGLLQSPSFLYRVELGGEAVEGRRYLDGWELASRLSFTLWNSIPDEELLRAAAAGEILEDEGLGAQYDRMIVDPRARRTLRHFTAELLRIDATSVDKSVGELSPTVWAAMQEETLRTVETLTFDVDADMREMLFTNTTHLNAGLAEHYGYDGVSSSDHQLVELDAADPRRGVLTQGAFLAANSPPHRTSATKRGVVIYQALLCGSVPPPPDDVATDEIEGDTTAPTARQRLARHREDPACAGCHSVMDPYGLALEQFDTTARFRVTENDETIDPSGEVDGAPFADAAEMGELLGGSEEVASCLVRQLFRFSTSHVETVGEMPIIEELVDGASTDGYRLVPTLRRVVLSESFRASGADMDGGAR